MDFLLHCLLDKINLHALCKNNCVRKIVNDGLSKTLIRALPYGNVWVDEPSPFVVSAVANSSVAYLTLKTVPQHIVLIPKV